MRGDRAASVTLRCRHLLPMVGPAVDGGWMRIDRGRIAALGSGRPPASCVDLDDAIILPGLVNAHTHLEFSDRATPLDPSGGLPAWIERVVHLRRHHAADAAAESRRILDTVARGLAESAAAGVTAIGEIATRAPLTAYATRGPLTRVFREGLGLAAASGAAAARRIAAEAETAAHGAILQGISPHAPYSVAAPLGRRLMHTAHRCRLPVAMHIAESREEDQLLSTGAGRFRELLESLGAWPTDAAPHLLSAAEWITALARGPRGIIVHGTFLPDDLPALIRAARHRDRLGVAICPRTTRALADRLPPLRAFRDAGLRVAIGTDSRASNPDLSVLAECRTLTDAGLASPRETLSMATRGGAWALMLEHRCGILAPGRPADLVILRPSTRHADPFTAALDPATRIVATMRSGRWIHGSP